MVKKQKLFFSAKCYRNRHQKFFKKPLFYFEKLHTKHAEKNKLQNKMKMFVDF